MIQGGFLIDHGGVGKEQERLLRFFWVCIQVDAGRTVQYVFICYKWTCF